MIDPTPPRTNLPTPTSDGSSGRRGQKRKRAHVPSVTEELDQEEKFRRFYDPDQNPDIRREIKRKSRALEREFAENRDDLLRGDGSGLAETVNRANRIYKDIKQTTDATLDSRLLVNVSDLAHRKTAQLVLGDNSTGIDVDEFLSKCISFMRNGGPIQHQDDDNNNNIIAFSASRRRDQRYDDDEDDERSNASLDWDILGRNACFQYNMRPPLPSFLLGPLSVEKKQRTQMRRRVRQAKDTTAKEVRPEALTKDDMQQSDENNLTKMCGTILARLGSHISKAEQTLRRAGFKEDDLQSKRGKAMLKKCRLSGNGQVSLFEYALNPRSFGQTVENLFYISFLIKEGAIGVDQDDDGLPTLSPAKPLTLEERREKQPKRHQAVFSLDYATWQELVRAFDIHDPMIPHRQDEEQTDVGRRGWYS